jgi:thiol:disulfide interchange protein DsbC
MSSRLLPALLAVLAAAGGARAEESVEAAIARLMKERFPRVIVHAVNAVPYFGPGAGLYEVTVDDTIVYTDARVSWVLNGNVIEAASGRDLTKERLDALSVIEFAKLPLELAIRQVKGEGRRKVAIFEDPNCPHCRSLEQVIASLDNVTVYTFLYPILSDQSVSRARQIWCTEDRVGAWRAAMAGLPTVSGAPACADPIDGLLALGKRLRVQGTPTLVFPDNRRVDGTLSRRDLDALLDASSAAAR